MENFTPIPALIGGGLIGLAVGIYLLFLGKVLGISGIVENAMKAKKFTDLTWHLSFLASLAIGAGIAKYMVPEYVPNMEIRFSWTTIFIAGILTGFGARLGSGCTSGHGISGLARLSPRSVVATVIFFVMTGITVYVVRHVPFVTSLLS